MKTAIRKPKINKPSKGMKMFFKQQRASAEKLINRAANRANRFKKQTGLAKVKARAAQLRRHARGSYTPHQGPEECARRIRHIAAGTHGYAKRVLE